MSRLRWASQKALIVVLLGSAVLLVTEVYYLQEMLAALIIFALLFSCGAAVLLMLFVVDRAGQSTVEFLELRAREVLHHARGWRTASEPRSRI